MSSPREIRSKIKSVKNIAKITKAMELVSVSKMQKAVEQALQTREYALRAVEVLHNIARDRYLRHPLIMKKSAGTTSLIVLISSNKGLCGGFNANTGRVLKEFIDTNASQIYKVVAIGRRAEALARRLGLEVVASFIDIPEEVHSEHIDSVMRIVLEEYTNEDVREVVIVYTTYVSALAQRARVRRLFPLREDIIRHVIREIEDAVDQESLQNVREETSMALYLFEPATDEVLDTVLPRLSKAMLFQTVLESRASEHSARMMAMKSATDNAKELVSDLTLSYNKVRQATVTREISEIAAGAEAL